MKERKIGGLGLFMVKKIMDYTEYEYQKEKNRFIIGKRFTIGGERWMWVKVEAADRLLTVKIDGRIDTITAPVLEGELKNSITKDIESLIFDFEKVEYMSSAGIRVIMGADKVMSRQGDMKLIHVNQEIMEMLDMTGLVDFLTIE